MYPSERKEERFFTWITLGEEEEFLFCVMDNAKTTDRFL